FDAIDNTKIAVEVFTSMFATMTVKRDALRRAASGGFINATDCADYLVKQGMPFLAAYKIVCGIVADCISNEKTLETMTLDEYRSFSDVFGEDIFEAISLETCVGGRCVTGGPARASVLRQIAAVKEVL
ncbi:MAG: argininosuccinate lyase, partial [Clostridia bacterium]|nr:argininosuccinate lyase [Clostridia bacterium]